MEDPNSEAYKHHLARIPDYFWVAEDGMKMQVFFYFFPFSLHFYSNLTMLNAQVNADD